VPDIVHRIEVNLMSFNHRFSRVVALIAFTICLPAIAAPPDEAEPPAKIMTARIKIAESSLIVVPVMINGSGPYDFMLDTGASLTMLEPKLADELALPRVGEKKIVAVQHTEIVSSVRVNSISVAGATTAGQDVIASDQVRRLPIKVRGVLGEDFLQNFDVLIDYRHQVLQLEVGLGPLAQTLMGEHLPLQLTGTLGGKPTQRRLIVSGHMREFGDNPTSLVLDSGTNYLVLFQESLGPTSSDRQTSVGAAATRMVQQLYLGGKHFSNVTAMAVSRHGEMDSDGLVPTSIFQSIFISHEGRFAILNPSVTK
jgi:predicted aspartyl protease